MEDPLCMTSSQDKVLVNSAESDEMRPFAHLV